MDNCEEPQVAATATLVGAAAQAAYEAAQAVENPRLRAMGVAHAQKLSANAQLEMERAAATARFARVPLWAACIPDLSYRDMVILGRIYSFQLSTTEDGRPGDYHKSLRNGAAELRIDRDNFKQAITRLCRLGYLVKVSNGPRRPASYLVDEVACMTVARANGYEG